MAAVVALTLLPHPAHSSGSARSATPARPGDAGAVTTVAVTLTDRGCSASRLSVPAGDVDVVVTNPGGTSVSEAELWSGTHVLAEREGVVVGTPESFALRLSPGTYELVCPGLRSSPTPLTVTRS